MDYVIREKAEAVVATGGSHLNGLADMAFITVYFPDNVIAHINVNWLSPVKVRTTLIGGRDKMLVWNDLEADEKIKVYDKGVNVTSREGVYDLLVSYRSGDVWAPKVDQTEALKAELGYFLDCITNGKTPFNDGEAGLRVVRMLEAADRSLAERGRSSCCRRRRWHRSGAVRAVLSVCRSCTVRCIPSSSTSAAPSTSRCSGQPSSLPPERGLLPVRRRRLLRPAGAWARRRRAPDGSLVGRLARRVVAQRQGAPAVRPVGGARQPAARAVPARRRARDRAHLRVQPRARRLLLLPPGAARSASGSTSRGCAWTGWKRIPFPRWPVDVTVETLMKRAVASRAREAAASAEFPFIWFWPDGRARLRDDDARRGRRRRARRSAAS